MNLLTYAPNGRVNEVVIFTNELKNISGHEKYIYVNLARHAYRNDFCFVGQQTLARISSCSLRTVQRCLAKLESVGLIRIEMHGRQKRYYLTIPDELIDLAQKFGFLQSTPNEEAESAAEQPCADESSASLDEIILHNTNHDICDNLSPVCPDTSSDHANIPGICGNLSHINKREIYNTNTPLPPHGKNRRVAPQRKRFGGGGSFSSADLHEIQKEFQQLQSTYPRHEDMREAFEVFIQMRAGLPPISELVSAIEYEKANNGKWSRESGRYVPYLKNWLKSGQFETALQFARAEAARVEAERAAATAAELEASVLHNTIQAPRLAEPDEAPAQEAIGPEQPFIEADFEACVSLWKPNSVIRTALAGYWRRLLFLGVLPSVDAARSARPQFSSMQDWLKAFKQAEFSKNKSLVSNTNTSCRGNQVACAAA